MSRHSCGIFLRRPLCLLHLGFLFAVPAIAQSQEPGQQPAESVTTSQASAESSPPAEGITRKSIPSMVAPDLTAPSGPEQTASPAQISKGNTAYFDGVVYDSKSGKTLSGVAIAIKELDRATLTNDKGQFIFDNVVPGIYTVLISQDGYQILTVEGVNIHPGVSTTLSRQRSALEPKPVEEGSEIYQMDSLEVVAEMVEEGQQSQIFDAKEFQQMVGAMGKQDFSKLAISDVAGAVGKQTGMSLVDGKYAVIRGLGDRYSNTTINGAYIPSADPSKKAVQLDLIPTHLVENLITSKSFIPNLPAEFSGGTIDIRTVRFPDKLTIKVGGGLEYSENATGKSMYVNPDRRMDFLGRVPDKLPSVIGLPREFPRGTRRPSDPPTEAQLQAQSQWRTLHRNGGTRPSSRDTEPARSLNFTYGNSTDTVGGKIGTILAFTQSQKFAITEGREINRGSNNFGSFAPRQSQFQDNFSEEISWGGLFSSSWRPNDDHDVTFSYITYTSAEDEVTLGRKLVNDEDGTIRNPTDAKPGIVTQYLGKYATVTRAFDEINYLYRSQNTAQLEGKHNLGLLNSGIKFDWIFSYSGAREDRPDQRHIKSFEVDYADPRLSGFPNLDPSKIDPTKATVLTAKNPLGGNPTNSFREFLNTNETLWQIKGDLAIPLLEKSKNLKLEMVTGYSFSRRDREVRGRLFKYDYGSGLARRINGDDDQFGVDFLRDFDNPDWIDGSGLQGNGLFFTDLTRAGDTIRNVDAYSQLSAAYLMGNFTWGGLKATAGYRWEAEERSYQILDELNPVDAIAGLNPKEPQENGNLFPRDASLKRDTVGKC